MHCPHRPSVVLVTDSASAHELVDLFRQPPLLPWKPVAADNVEHARFLVQIEACDVLLVEGSADVQDLDWLLQPTRVPVLFLSEIEPLVIQRALAYGVHLWLPRGLAVDHPALLAEALAHVSHAFSAFAQPAGHDGADCTARVQRLADLLWHALPTEGKRGWLSQRFMLERLHEEIERAERHRTTVSLVLAELELDPAADHPSAKAAAADAESALREWTAERVLRIKRRSDVAGQYGLQGFMLLLPHTNEPGAENVCRRLRHDFARSPWKVHASFGVAGYGTTGQTPKGLLRAAEERLDAERGQLAQ